MRRPFALIALLALCGAALYLAERRKHPDAVSANAVVNMAADWQRDLSRVPLHLSWRKNARRVGRLSIPNNVPPSSTSTRWEGAWPRTHDGAFLIAST